jgi:hypothetical protein
MIYDSTRPVHAVKPGCWPRKRHRGRSLCNRVIGTWTNTTQDPEKMTCKTCRKRFEADLQDRTEHSEATQSHSDKRNTNDWTD